MEYCIQPGPFALTKHESKVDSDKSLGLYM